MECGISPEVFWECSWYELGLLARQHQHALVEQWDFTRHIMAAMGAGKGNPKKVMKLPIDGKPGRHAPKNLEHARQIAERLLPYFGKKKEA